MKSEMLWVSKGVIFHFVFNFCVSFLKITLASVTLAVYKTLFMEEEWTGIVNGEDVNLIKKNGRFYTLNGGEKREIDEQQIQQKRFVKSPLPHVPAAGYTGRGDNYSKQSIQWLKWVEKDLGRSLQTALSNEGEYRVRGASRLYRLDGFDAATKTAYEFHGCRWHGHECIKDRSASDPRTGFTLDALLFRTQEKEKELKSLGYKVVTMWQCQFEKALSENQEMKSFIEQQRIASRLRIRDSLHGGRTGASILHANVEDHPGMKIFYLDFTR